MKYRTIFELQESQWMTLITPDNITVTIEFKDFVQGSVLKKGWFDELMELLYAHNLEEEISAVSGLIKNIAKYPESFWIAEKLHFVENSKLLEIIKNKSTEVLL